MYAEGFPSKLKKARNDSGFTQREVSDAIGIAQSAIARYETGKLEPCLEVLGTLADFYGVSVDWLLGTKGEQDWHRITPDKIAERHLP